MLVAGLSDEQEAFRDAARALAETKIRPAAEEAERSGAVPASVTSALAQMGLDIPVPEELGGSGLPDLVTLAAVVEALAHGDPGIAYGTAVNASFALLLSRLGSPAQQERHLAAMLDGGERATVAYYEGFGRGLDDLATTATAQGSKWSIVGEKVAVPHPGTATRVAVVTRGDDGPQVFVVEDAWSGGMEVTRDDAVTGKLGLLAVPTGNVRIDGLVVDEAHRLADGDVAAAVAALRVLMAAVALGAGQAALEYAAGYAIEREAFGQPIARFQGVSFPLAEVEMDLSAARLHLWDLAARVEGGGAVPEDAEVTAAVAEVMGATLRSTVVAINTLGGHGFLTDHPIERWYRAVGTLSTIDFDPVARPFAPA